MAVPIPKLIVADSERDADMLFATGFFVPDPFIYLSHNGRTSVVLSDLEIDRGRKQATVDEVLALSDFAKKTKSGSPDFGDQVAAFLLSRKVRRASVPASF